MQWPDRKKDNVIVFHHYTFFVPVKVDYMSAIILKNLHKQRRFIKRCNLYVCECVCVRVIVCMYVEQIATELGLCNRKHKVKNNTPFTLTWASYPDFVSSHIVVSPLRTTDGASLAPLSSFPDPFRACSSWHPVVPGSLLIHCGSDTGWSSPQHRWLDHWRQLTDPERRPETDSLPGRILNAMPLYSVV